MLEINGDFGRKVDEFSYYKRENLYSLVGSRFDFEFEFEIKDSDKIGYGSLTQQLNFLDSDRKDIGCGEFRV